MTTLPYLRNLIVGSQKISVPTARLRFGPWLHAVMPIKQTQLPHSHTQMTSLAGPIHGHMGQITAHQHVLDAWTIPFITADFLIIFW